MHPQFWGEDVDYTGKRVVVIGSGATAVTLIPAVAERAAHVTMLQRSPSYILSLPASDPIAGVLGRVLPTRLAYPVVRLEAGLQRGALVQWEGAISAQPGRGFVSVALRLVTSRAG